MARRIRTIAIAKINVPAVHASLVDETEVQKSERQLREGIQYRPVPVLKTDHGYWLIGGYSDLMAAVALKLKTVRCSVIEGRDAHEFARLVAVEDFAPVETSLLNRAQASTGRLRADIRRLGFGDLRDFRDIVCIACLSMEAAVAARKYGLDDDREVLLAATKERSSEAQVMVIERFYTRHRTGMLQ